MTGPPEYVSQRSTELYSIYTLYGIPKPNVMCGYTENDTRYSVNGTTKPDMNYAHDYFLKLETNKMCKSVIYCKAVGFLNKTDSWNATVNRKCKLFFCFFICTIFYFRHLSFSSVILTSSNTYIQGSLAVKFYSFAIEID